MDFAELSRRTGMGARGLRYTVDYDVLDPKFLITRDLAAGRGVAREFDPFTAFAIALAAALHEAGLSRSRTKAAMAIIFKWARQLAPSEAKGRDYMVLLGLLASAEAVDVQIGDAQNIQILGVRPVSSFPIPMGPPTSTEWLALDTGMPMAVGYEPLIVTRLSLRILAKRISE